MEGSVSVQDIFLVCHLGFIANRPLGIDPELSRYPKIEAMVGRMDERATFQANSILWWEPGVIGYAEDGKTPVFDT
jgi:glutathione S-transferase